MGTIKRRQTLHYKKTREVYNTMMSQTLLYKYLHLGIAVRSASHLDSITQFYGIIASRLGWSQNKAFDHFRSLKYITMCDNVPEQAKPHFPQTEKENLKC